MPSQCVWRAIAAHLVALTLAGCGSSTGADSPVGDGHDHSDRLRTPPHMPEVPPLDGAQIATKGTRLVSCSRAANGPQARAEVRNVADMAADYTVTASWTAASGAVATRAVAVLRDVPAGVTRTATLIAAPNGATTSCSLHVEYGRLAVSATVHTPLSSPTARDRRLGSPVLSTPIRGGVLPIPGDDVRLNANFGRPGGPAGRHTGVDIFAPAGSDVVAVVDGTLYSVGVSGLAGHRLWLRDAAGTDYLYAHLGGFADGVADGTVVKAGQLIGWVGVAKGPSSRTFLHIEVHRAGRPVDPSPVLRRFHPG